MKGLIMKKEEERNIYAVFDDKTIRVYQAYNNEIADEALKLGRFGSKFSLNRMTWIKPSFLWMMYRLNFIYGLNTCFGLFSFFQKKSKTLNFKYFHKKTVPF
ncbi:hypothetical protein AXF11_08495 [Leptotrichia sp. oral taxon 847]|nr:hypothetical protein AXF11_08495 [Leptotrichia sp. oral taxon 847]